MTRIATAVLACCATCLIGNASAGLVVNLSAGSGTDTTTDGATVTTWVAAGDTAPTTFTRSGGDARYVADSGGGIAAIDFDRSSPFLGDITSALGGSTTITGATILVWANFDGYAHGAGSSSYYFSIDGSGNEHTLGRDQGAAGDDTLYHYDGGGATYGTAQSAGWNLYVAKFYGAPVGSTSAEAWIDPVGDGTVVTGTADLTNSDGIGYSGNADSVRIGSWTTGGSGLDGQIRALRIYDEILSDAEIQEAAGSMVTAAPTNPAPRLSIAASGSNAVTLSWSGDAYHLLSSTNLDAWRIEAEAVSPMTWPTDEDRMFFRLADTFSGLQTGLVFRTRVATDTWRDLEYHLDTGDLYLIGEQAHGLDYQDAGSNDFWWCNMGTGLDGDGLLEFLMANNPGAAAAKTTATGNGWSGFTGAQYSFLIFEPLAAQQTFVNHTAPASPGDTETTEAYTADYITIPNTNLLFTVYLDSNADRSYFGLGGPSLVTTPLPPGDGTSSRDNGARYDIAFKMNIQLSEAKKLELMSTFTPVSPLYDDSSSAYYYVHPPGL